MELKKLLKKEAYHKVLKFFHENPASVDTARGVATWTNQDIHKVRVILNKLAGLGLLVAHRVSSTVGYSYTSDKETVAKVDRLLKEDL